LVGGGKRFLHLYDISNYSVVFRSKCVKKTDFVSCLDAPSGPQTNIFSSVVAFGTFEKSVYVMDTISDTISC